MTNFNDMREGIAAGIDCNTREILCHLQARDHAEQAACASDATAEAIGNVSQSLGDVEFQLDFAKSAVGQLPRMLSSAAARLQSIRSSVNSAHAAAGNQTPELESAKKSSIATKNEAGASPDIWPKPSKIPKPPPISTAKPSATAVSRL